jgi:5-methylcytosine-specific restriction protein A
MTLTGGNKAIADHAVDGKELLLFEALGAGRVRFRGAFNCADFSYELGVDRAGSQRKVIVFRLVPSNGREPPNVPEPEVPVERSELRRRAYAAAGPAREVTSDAPTSYYTRSAAVRAYVLVRASGTCEGCEMPAPFVTSAGAPYLEPHHIRRLTDGGPDDPRYMAALCPNCHRRVHCGQDSEMFNHQLQGRITAKEPLGDQPRAPRAAR